MSDEEIMTAEEAELDQAAGASGPVTFELFTFTDRPTKFMLFRAVADEVTHWMTPNGAWVPMPATDEGTEKLLRFLVDSDDLPTLGEQPDE